MSEETIKGTWSEELLLEPISEAGFVNAVFSFNFRYGSEEEKATTLQEAQKHGLKIIPVLHFYWTEENVQGAIDLVNLWKNHSGIGGWLLFDEPQINEIPVADQQTFYNAIKGADPDHILYTAFMADPMLPAYYSITTFDRAVVTYYPVRSYGDWRAFLISHLNSWISSTGNRDVIPNMQAFHDNGEVEYANPIRTLAEQFFYWKQRGLTDRGYLIYAWKDGAGTDSSGILEIEGMLAEVTSLNDDPSVEMRLIGYDYTNSLYQILAVDPTTKALLVKAVFERYTDAEAVAAAEADTDFVHAGVIRHRGSTLRGGTQTEGRVSAYARDAVSNYTVGDKTYGNAPFREVMANTPSSITLSDAAETYHYADQNNAVEYITLYAFTFVIESDGTSRVFTVGSKKYVTVGN